MAPNEYGNLGFVPSHLLEKGLDVIAIVLPVVNVAPLPGRAPMPLIVKAEQSIARPVKGPGHWLVAVAMLPKSMNDGHHCPGGCARVPGLIVKGQILSPGKGACQG
jgi:hypothetical protein